MSDHERKDRLIQTRVPESLESALKDEATRRRLPVSQLVRNILEDTLEIVGGVVDGVDAIVQESIQMGRQVGQGVGQGVARARGLHSRGAASVVEPAEPVAPAAAPAPPVSVPDAALLDDVFAWNEVVPNKAAACSRCGVGLPAGRTAFVGLRDDPSRGRAWSCADCVALLRS